MPDLLSAGVGAGIGMLGMMEQNRRQNKQNAFQKQLMNIQFKNQKTLDQLGFDNQLKMWEDTNYPAQMRMLKQAGLNPGLLYGMSGAGGSSTGTQTGGQAASGNANSPMDINGAINAAKAAAEIDLMKAQANKTEKEANVVGETGVREAEARINKMISETTNENLKSELIKLQSQGQEIENTYKPYLLDAELNQYAANLNILQQQYELTADQYDSLVALAEANAVGAVLNNELTKSKTKLTDEQKREIENSIQQKWEQLDINWQTLDVDKLYKEESIKIQKFEAELKEEFPNIANVTGSLFRDSGRAFKALKAKLKRPDYTKGIN